MQVWDLIVVGAGVAGAALAYKLSSLLLRGVHQSGRGGLQHH